MAGLRAGPSLRNIGWPLAIACLYVILAGIYTYLGMWHYTIFRVGIDDATFTQIANSALTGFSATEEGSVNHLLVHFSPILFVTEPFVRAFDGARGLILLQCLLTAAIIFPLWGIATSRFPQWLAFVVTLVAATYPPLSAEAVGDFHELAFAPLLTATLVWAVDRKLWKMAIAAAAILATVKEDQFVSLAFIGLVIAFALGRRDRQMRRCGLWITAIAITTAAFYFGLLRPMIDPHFPYFSLHYYEWWRFPTTTAGFADALSPLRAEYLFAILLPLAFLPLGSRYMLFALPGLAEVLFSHEAVTMGLGTQYTATWSGYVLCAFVDGASKLFRNSQFAAEGALLFALLASIWTSRYNSPINPGFALYRQPTIDDQIRERELARLPRAATIGTGGWIIGHLGMDTHATIAMTDQDYLVFDAFTDPNYWKTIDAVKVEELLRSGAYEKVFDGAGIVVLARSTVNIVIDRSSVPCSVSYDGVMWYRIPAGDFPPIDVRLSKCGFNALGRNLSPDRPHWSIPSAATQARFVFTSLDEVISVKGTRNIERTAAAHHVPVSWMVGDIRHMAYAADYNAFHRANGDDAQAQFWGDLHAAMSAKLPWYVPSVSILTAGVERNVRRALSFGEHAFWGITWNSRGTDGTSDLGAPWGTYCADIHSYKRPQPDGGCSFLAFEWTARDLTRAYLSGREAAFSTDPDDLLQRGGFSPKSAASYARKLVDAYAAAGQAQPIVMTVQEEPTDGVIAANAVVMNALFDEAVRDGMHSETLTQAARDARTFSAAPRAIAFPYIIGGKEVGSDLLHGDTLYPATIDYHDSQVGMTFLSGRTLPSRVFRYADYPVSRFDRPLPEVPRREMPLLLGASVKGGWLNLTLAAPQALRFGLAIWSDASQPKIIGPGSIRAGRAATVLVFDLRRGRNDVRYRCIDCRSSTFTYSL